MYLVIIIFIIRFKSQQSTSWTTWYFLWSLYHTLLFMYSRKGVQQQKRLFSEAIMKIIWPKICTHIKLYICAQQMCTTLGTVTTQRNNESEMKKVRGYQHDFLTDSRGVKPDYILFWLRNKLYFLGIDAKHGYHCCAQENNVVKEKLIATVHGVAI